MCYQTEICVLKNTGLQNQHKYICLTKLQQIYNLMDNHYENMPMYYTDFCYIVKIEKKKSVENV